jgi:hypothetical protein
LAGPATEWNGIHAPRFRHSNAGMEPVFHFFTHSYAGLTEKTIFSNRFFRMRGVLLTEKWRHTRSFRKGDEIKKERRHHMSTGLLYHGFGVVGYKYVHTRYENATVVFRVAEFL